MVYPQEDKKVKMERQTTEGQIENKQHVDIFEKPKLSVITFSVIGINTRSNRQMWLHLVKKQDIFYSVYKKEALITKGDSKYEIYL